MAEESQQLQQQQRQLEPAESHTQIGMPPGLALSFPLEAAQDDSDDDEVDECSYLSVQQTLVSSGAIDDPCSDLQYSNLPSIGSANHFNGTCDRCCFHPKGRCLNGFNCNHCHFDHEKRKRKSKKKSPLAKNSLSSAGEDASDAHSVSDASSLPVSPTRPFGAGGMLPPTEQPVSAAAAVTTPTMPRHTTASCDSNLLTPEKCQELEYQRGREEYARQLREENKYLRACLAHYVGSAQLAGPCGPFQPAHGVNGLMPEESCEVFATQPAKFSCQPTLPWPTPDGLQPQMLVGNNLHDPWSSMAPDAMWWPQGDSSWQGDISGVCHSTTVLSAHPQVSACQEQGVDLYPADALAPISAFPACGGS